LAALGWLFGLAAVLAIATTALFVSRDPPR
jgi:hypothetical protein